MHNISVGIADDHSLFREGIRMILSGMEGITCAFEAESGRALLACLETSTADIVLLDIEMKDMGGIETLKALSGLAHKPKIIVLSMHTEPRMMSYMMELGASSYLPKDVKREDLEHAIRMVHREGVYLTEAISRALLAGIQHKKPKYAPETDLSPREREVLALICMEYTTSEIGEKLFISERTVEGHRKNLCLKLEVKNTAGLVKKALQLNLADGL